MQFLKSAGICFALLTAALWLNTCSANQHSKLTSQPKVKEFINHMVNKHQFNQKELTTLFDKVNFRPEIIAHIEKPYEANPWYIYQNKFITAERINKGVQFWQTHDEILAKGQKIYGVAKKIIVAIIGVESFYGAVKGKYSVIDTLSTLAFNYPPRSTFFRRELEEYLLLCHEQNWDALKILGSYAGAVGQPQFMPSSHRAYAVNFKHNGQIDLFVNIDHIIGSVANYFHVHGWQDGLPIAVPARVSGSKYLSILAKNRLPKPSMSLTELAKYAVFPCSKQLIPASTKAVLFQIEIAPNKFEYWLGFNNFYVITRYNNSILYALAVTKLSTSIKNKYKQS